MAAPRHLGGVPGTATLFQLLAARKGLPGAHAARNSRPGHLSAVAGRQLLCRSHRLAATATGRARHDGEAHGDWGCPYVYAGAVEDVSGAPIQALADYDTDEREFSVAAIVDSSTAVWRGVAGV